MRKLFLAALLSASLFAFGGHDRHDMHGAFKSLNLTQTQKEQVKALFDKARNDSEKGNKEGFAAAFAGETFNRQSFLSLNAAHAESRADFYESLHAILTPEQRAQFVKDASRRFERDADKKPNDIKEKK
ncbi:MAG: Spy/CpxP family protein refolding chaperone [Helicobacteraceae bacterium]|jgi:Spy/CpxP family protein refolding chaperone|nr:Spy/CpxP family protein refolding chaperone [Helicobacteraceae bacterium]